jgi:hypothetical protein
LSICILYIPSFIFFSEIEKLRYLFDYVGKVRLRGPDHALSGVSMVGKGVKLWEMRNIIVPKNEITMGILEVVSIARMSSLPRLYHHSLTCLEERSTLKANPESQI